MIEEVEVSGNDVSFTVVLTTPACPLKELIHNNCVRAVQMHIGEQVRVTVNMAADEFPKLTFRSTSFTKKDEDDFALVGDLTLHGVTKSVKLAAKYNGGMTDFYGNNKIGFEVEYTRDKAAPTLSSTVSNFERRIASISGLKLSVASSTSALLNFVIWSTASFPTRASPIKTTKFGLLSLTSLANSFMRGVLSCILPAVSTSTASTCFLVA